MKKINVLHFELDDDIGGIEVFLKNIMSQMSADVNFEFITTVEKPGLGDEFINMGGEIHKIPSYFKFIQNYKAIKNILINHDYDVVHIHKNSAANIIPIFMAKKYSKQSKIFVHAHNTAPSKGKITSVLHYINRNKMNQIINQGFGCSSEAANWIFGKKFCREKNVPIVRNGIIVDDFKYSTDKRNSLREKYDIENKFVIGHVGRFVNQKNHKGIIDIFNEYYKKNNQSILMLVGSGELEKEIKQKVDKAGLQNNVIFTGDRTDVNELLQAMDVFILPSLYEGLPIVGVEAQAAGLPLIVADNVSREVDLTGNVDFVNINDLIGWVNKLEHIKEHFCRKDVSSSIINKGYDIKTTAEILEHYYNGEIKCVK